MCILSVVTSLRAVRGRLAFNFRPRDTVAAYNYDTCSVVRWRPFAEFDPTPPPRESGGGSVCDTPRRPRLRERECNYFRADVNSSTRIRKYLNHLITRNATGRAGRVRESCGRGFWPGSIRSPLWRNWGFKKGGI
ncbi:hypothetical protein EVAR_30936_1 [Eumeta japonica]|uniref:Uncharacterized protein n=1 Tax=Eumeta variegata TaxID=151549 RepID=A0A4C1V4Q1_EUMVA|nr:hypothetical protein EVAR_30936_1 [Eumeta japonica]